MSAALEKLRERRAITARLQSAAASEQKAQSQVSATLLDGLTLDAFAGSGCVLRIYSQVLNEEVLLAADNAAITPSETRIVYRAREMRELLDATPQGLRLLHEVKTVFFGSEIIADMDN